METLALPKTASTVTEPELNLLLVRDRRDDWRRWRTAVVSSICIHIVLIVFAMEYRESAYVPPPEQILVRHVTPLYTPPELTQKAPNKALVSKEMSVESIAPRPELKKPSPAPVAKKSQPAPAPVAPPPPQVARVIPKPVEMEAPKIPSPVQSTQPAQIVTAQPLPPRQVQPEQPKLAFENVAPRERVSGNGTGTGAIRIPTNSVQEALRNLSQGGTTGAQSVGDIGVESGGIGPGMNLPPSAGRPHSNLELKSDPMGVDFRPYMLQVLAAVRRNWFAVYPEAARLGQRGQVVLQFAIGKQGLVQKVVFNGESGAKALDQSAVAAISASNPLPPLPVEFKGDRIVLQMTFLYNMPR
jgi:TonB family protein